jgi:hypothetical protein
MLQYAHTFELEMYNPPAAQKQPTCSTPRPKQGSTPQILSSKTTRDPVPGPGSSCPNLDKGTQVGGA